MLREILTIGDLHPMVDISNRRRWIALLLSLAFPFYGSSMAQAFSGSEGASFLELPVGARPAALGSAYTMLAEDAYAPVWNPAGLAFLDNPQFAGMHML